MAFSTALFEYHTFLHHSQTWKRLTSVKLEFEYHTFLHHSQTPGLILPFADPFEYHTFLHHSQTSGAITTLSFSLSTIRFYIILKRDQ